MKKNTYLIAAGGTGGHIHPGIAIAEEIKKQDTDSKIFFCGTKTGMENHLVPENGFELLHISAKGLPGKFSFKSLLSGLNFIKGVITCCRIISKRKVDIVIGTGGYVCGPAVFAGAIMRIPTILHEQNAFPGKANLWLSKFADAVCISYPKTIKYFSKAKKVIITGNPVRDVFYNLKKADARASLGFDAACKIVFITGGSLGARSINNAAVGLVEKFGDPGYKIILACGRNEYDTVAERTSKYSDIIDVKAYLNDQHLYLASADLIVCRAGALTCSEIALLEKASVMIPYPFAAGDHQTLNAKAFSEIGAAVLIPDKDLNSFILYSAIDKIINNSEKIETMEKLSSTLSYPNAPDLIYRQIESLLKKVAAQ